MNHQGQQETYIKKIGNIVGMYIPYIFTQTNSGDRYGYGVEGYHHELQGVSKALSEAKSRHTTARSITQSSAPQVWARTETLAITLRPNPTRPMTRKTTPRIHTRAVRSLDGALHVCLE